VARRSSEARSKAAPAGTALDGGLKLLARRAHSRLELRRKLQRRGFGTDDVEAALGRLTELGYLDDAAFARDLVRRRSTSRGPLALSAELWSKGIDRTGAAEALGDFPLEAQIEAATRLAERLCSGSAVMGYRELLDRVGPRLLRRGFPAPVVRAACREVWTGTTGKAAG
jgi:regulatory protein